MIEWTKALDELKVTHKNAENAFTQWANQAPQPMREALQKNWEMANQELTEALGTKPQKSSELLEYAYANLREANAAVATALGTAAPVTDLVFKLQQATDAARRVSLSVGSSIEPVDPWPRKK